MEEKGYLALVLHTHLPYVHHPESETVMEERWLFEAITESYMPLLQVFERLERDGVPFRLTLSLSPTLLSMLSSPLLQERYLRHLDQQIALAGKEIVRTSGDARLNKLAALYFSRFSAIRRDFTERYGGNPARGFKRLQEAGFLDLITSSATHAFLPYATTEQSLWAQIENAVTIHTEQLGRAPKGIWLPECGYREGLDRILAECGLQYFMTDSHAVDHAYPRPETGIYGPVRLPYGVSAFARDQEASSQVWSSLLGYPGDCDYREFYRDIAYDLNEEYINPHLHGSGLRLDSGIKYYRITGAGEHKEPYVPEWALGKAARHAEHFLHGRERQAEAAEAGMDQRPIIVAAYDTELFGHWWYEGPDWLESLCRKIHSEQQTIRLVTPADYLAEYPDGQTGHMTFSSWGRGGYGEVWLGESNEWMYRHLHRMEEQMIHLADSFPDETGWRRRALNQTARELMLAQSSDWAFIMDGNTVVEYAVKRFRQHAGRFRRLAAGIRSGRLDLRWLREVERRDAIAPAVDYRVFRSSSEVPAVQDHSADSRGKRWTIIAHPAEQNAAVETAVRRKAASVQADRPLSVLMLAWEFPPMVVGGLSRHVFELSRKLAEQGMVVHVVTTRVEGYPDYEVNEGIHVHRVGTYQSHELDFMGWVFQLNLQMVDYCRDLISHHVRFDAVHAHDWLVGRAAKALKHDLGLPLIATIHATEYVRNQGLHSDLQRRIHALEWELTYEAERVIGCSDYMERELLKLFELPPEKLDIIPNGVDPGSLRPTGAAHTLREPFALPHEKIVLFVGRLVREKGVHVLLESIPAVLAACPDTKVVVAGKGPMLAELKERADMLGISGKVMFPGFLDDSARNGLFNLSSAAVFPSLYEPFGIVALEAMAAGAPVIVSGVGGLQEIVEYGRDGYTVLPGDAQSLASHIVLMLRDEASARSMAACAYRKVCERYSWDAIAEQTLESYLKAVSAQRSPASRELAFSGARR